jgi:hypothetical protein
MFRILLYIFLIYLAYQFIFNFIIPVYKATQQVKKGFREMHHRMNDFTNGEQQSSSQQSSSQQSRSSNNSAKESAGDYIDFEEVK